MRKILLSLLAVSGSLLTFGQQSPQYTQYMVNPYLMNPALGSVEDMVDIKAGHRAQWVGFNQNSATEGDDGSPTYVDSPIGVAPRTYYLSGHSPIGKPHHAMHFVTERTTWFGAGGKVVYDQTGPSTWGSYMVSGTFNMGIIKPKMSGINKKGGLRMSIGMFLGMSQYSLDWDQLTFGDPNEPLQLGKSGTENSFNPDGTFGAWFYNEKLFFGIALDHIFGNELKLNVPDNLDRDGFPTLARHTFVTAGYNYEVTDQLTWSPSLLGKFTPGAPLSIDVNNKIMYEDSYWGGISYRHLDALSIAVGAIITYNYEIAYSYDFTTTDIRTFGNAAATHEITLGYRIAPKVSSMNAEDHNWGHHGHYKGKKYKGGR